MKWYWVLRGAHVRVRVFMNGAKCGDLCFRDEEFRVLLGLLRGRVLFFNEDEEPKYNLPPVEPAATPPAQGNP